jgi:hypothetical protein
MSICKRVRATLLAPTVLLALTLAPALANAQSVAAPAYRAGDSWTYREINGYNNLERATIVREVKQANGGLRVVTATGDGKLVDESAFSDAGTLTDGMLNDRAHGPLQPSLSLRPFPLSEGQRWSQTVNRTDAVWKDQRAVRVDGRVYGWETVRVPAGEFKALRIERVMYLGDQDSFRNQTHRHEIEWYSPDLRMPVKLQVRERFRPYPYAVIGPFQEQDWYVQELVAHKRAN